jgi:hypothetical protein
MFLLAVAADFKTELGKLFNKGYLIQRLLTWDY